MRKAYLVGVFALVVFIILNVYLPLEKANIIFDNFSKAAIGVAALITAYFGSSYFFEEVLRKRRIDNYRKMFPYDKYGDSWDIVVGALGTVLGNQTRTIQTINSFILNY